MDDLIQPIERTGRVECRRPRCGNGKQRAAKKLEINESRRKQNQKQGVPNTRKKYGTRGALSPPKLIQSDWEISQRDLPAIDSCDADPNIITTGTDTGHDAMGDDPGPRACEIGVRSPESRSRSQRSGNWGKQSYITGPAKSAMRCRLNCKRIQRHGRGIPTRYKWLLIALVCHSRNRFCWNLPRRQGFIQCMSVHATAAPAAREKPDHRTAQVQQHEAVTSQPRAAGVLSNRASWLSLPTYVLQLHGPPERLRPLCLWAETNAQGSQPCQLLLYSSRAALHLYGRAATTPRNCQVDLDVLPAHFGRAYSFDIASPDGFTPPSIKFGRP
ncbi:hypothetical protein V8E51_007925 [Hyaloscypha variabilis]